jgi:hypothetical protein
VEEIESVLGGEAPQMGWLDVDEAERWQEVMRASIEDLDRPPTLRRSSGQR